MRPVTQRITACPRRGDGADRHGVPGDCLRAAVASLLDRPYESVPHFAMHGRRWWDAMRRWARADDSDWAVVPVVAGSIRYALADPSDVGGLVLLRGPSPRRVPHVVVADARDLRTVWDPHPSRAGLTDAHEAYAFVAPYWPPPEQLAITAAEGPP